VADVNFKNPFRRALNADAPTATGPLTPMEVWETPVDFNRATRRWAGLVRGRWGWKPKPSETGGVPRYVRRHYSEVVMLAPKTRRQRRHRARILRAMR
jgi:hypothetical protein